MIGGVGGRAGEGVRDGDLDGDLGGVAGTGIGNGNCACASISMHSSLIVFFFPPAFVIAIP